MPETESKTETHVTSSHWGAFQVHVRDGRIVSTAPFAADQDANDIPTAIPDAVYHQARVARPAFRRGWLEGKPGARAGAGRGKDDYVELPWDEALDIAAEEIGRIRREHGNRAIFGGSYGWSSAGRFHHAQSQVHRFLNSIGGFTSSFASYSTGAAQAIMPHVLGIPFLELTWNWQNDWPTVIDHTRTLVMFGGINRKNAQVSMGGVTRHETADRLQECLDRGMALINISPQKSDAPGDADWMPVRPGSDCALMLALAHVLETEELLDRDFLASHAVGYGRFSPYLLGTVDGCPKSPEWAAEICGITPEAIRDLARQMARTRTLITVAWSLQRAQNGEQPFWMGAVLAAMLGQIGLPGGGIGYGYGAIGGVALPIRRLKGLTLPQGENPVEDFIPVARIADMLLNPGGAYDFNGMQRNYPDIRLVYWCGGNPFHHHQDLARLEEAWRRPETIIVNEAWWTATALRADIVFPATTPYEREDIARTTSDAFLFHMPRLTAPVGAARDDYDIFLGLASRLGAGANFGEGRDADGWLRYLYNRFRQSNAAVGVDIPDYEELRQRNWVKLDIEGPEHNPDHGRIPFADFRADPVAAPLNTPSGRIEIFSETIDGFGYAECPGHPVWRAPDEWLGADGLTARWPLHLISPQPADKLHSQLECAIRDRPDARPCRVVIHPDDAARRRIADGDAVRLFNERGACRARAHISAEIRPGVVALPTGAWYRPDDQAVDQDGNPNVLTRDRGTSRLGQGSSAHTTLVELEAMPAGAGAAP